MPVPLGKREIEKTTCIYKVFRDLADDFPWGHRVSECDNLRLFRFIVDTLPIAICLVDPRPKILFWCAGAKQISGYLRQNVVGRFLRQLPTIAGDIEDSNRNPCHPLSLAFRDAGLKTNSQSRAQPARKPTSRVVQTGQGL